MLFVFSLRAGSEPDCSQEPHIPCGDMWGLIRSGSSMNPRLLEGEGEGQCSPEEVYQCSFAAAKL